MTKPATKCPMCKAGELSFHDTSPANETDQGTGKPYFMCSDQNKCGLICSVNRVDWLRELFRKVKG